MIFDTTRETLNAKAKVSDACLVAFSGGKDSLAVLVFESQERRAEFAEALGLPDNKWMDGAFVARKIAPQEQPSPHAAQRRD